MLVWKIAQYCMQKKRNQSQKIVTPVLSRVAKWAIFVLKRVRVWNASAAQFPLSVQQFRLSIKNIKY